jgi:hypothetical protein
MCHSRPAGASGKFAAAGFFLTPLTAAGQIAWNSAGFQGANPAMTKVPPKKDIRQERLAQALRDNLRKRKEQNRARDDVDANPPPAAEGDVGGTTA